MLAERLEAIGMGLEAAFHELNADYTATAAPASPAMATGIGVEKLQERLGSVFGIDANEEVVRKLIAWGDISGGSRLRCQEFTRLMRSATGFNRVKAANPGCTKRPASAPARAPLPASIPGPGNIGEDGYVTPQGGNNESLDIIKKLSEEWYIAANEPQFLGGTSIRAAFRSVILKKGNNGASSNGLSPKRHADFLASRGGLVCMYVSQMRACSYNTRRCNLRTLHTNTNATPIRNHHRRGRLSGSSRVLG